MQHRRLVIAVAVAGVLATPALTVPATAEAPEPFGPFEARASGEVMHTTVLDVAGATTLLDAGVGVTEGQVDSRGTPRSHAEASNLDVVAGDAPAPGALASAEQSAPPDNESAVTETLVPVPDNPLLGLGVSTSTAHARWLGDQNCLPGDTPIQFSRASTSDVDLVDASDTGLPDLGLPDLGIPGLPELPGLPAGGLLALPGTASTTQSTALVPNGETRKVVSEVVGSTADLELGGGQIAIRVLTEPSLTASATGSPGGASLQYTAPVVYVEAAGNEVPIPELPGQSIPIPGTPGVVIELSLGEVTRNVAPDGTSASGEASVLHLEIGLDAGLLDPAVLGDLLGGADPALLTGLLQGADEQTLGDLGAAADDAGLLDLGGLLGGLLGGDLLGGLLGLDPADLQGLVADADPATQQGLLATAGPGLIQDLLAGASPDALRGALAADGPAAAVGLTIAEVDLFPMSATVTAPAGGVDCGDTGADFELTRLAGKDRYATSVAAAKEFGPGTDVILATGEVGRYADALSADYLAGVIDAPILLVRRNHIPGSVKQALQRRDPETVYVIGGASAISRQATRSLKQDGYTVRRIFGPDRFATNAAVLQAGEDAAAGLGIVATGLAFPDAMTAGGLTFAKGLPLGLSRTNDIHDDVVQGLVDANVDRVLIMGGESAVGPAVVAELAAAGIEVQQRFSGADRSETSTLAAQYAVVNFNFDDRAVNVASGYEIGNGADALSGGPLSGRALRPILITADEDSIGGLRGFLTDHADTLVEGFVFGGPVALTEKAVSTLEGVVNTARES